MRTSRECNQAIQKLGKRGQGPLIPPCLSLTSPPNSTFSLQAIRPPAVQVAIQSFTCQSQWLCPQLQPVKTWACHKKVHCQVCASPHPAWARSLMKMPELKHWAYQYSLLSLACGQLARLHPDLPLHHRTCRQRSNHHALTEGTWDNYLLWEG